MDDQEIIVLISGLEMDKDVDKAELFTTRMQKAMDINDPDSSKKFVANYKKFSYGAQDELTANVGEIVEYHEVDNQPKQKRKRAEIYHFDYYEELGEKFNKKPLVMRIMMLFWAVGKKLPRVFYALFFSQKSTFLKKIQFTYSAIILIIISLFGLTLITSFMTLISNELLSDANNGVAQFFKDIYHYLKGSWLDVLPSIYDQLKEHGTKIIGAFAAVYLLLPKSKTIINVIANDYLCLMYYFDYGEQKLNILGKLEELIEKIAEEHPGKPISIYSYSFGSVIALDALFPYSDHVSYRITEKVEKLITIGCPYDYINTYWPHYYSDRIIGNSNLKQWYNVYTSLDVLSTRFNEKRNKKVQAFGVEVKDLKFDFFNPKRFSLVDFVMLMGLRAHSMYWDDNKNSSSCFNSLMKADLGRKNEE